MRVACPRAAQPEPGARLLQGETASVKKGQRVRCIRLPPTVAALRNCAEAPASRASATIG